MAQAMIMPKKYFFKKNGLNGPLAFGYVKTFLKGTTTNATTWSDEDGTTPNANPVVLNDFGYAEFFIDGAYTIEVYDVDDVLQWTENISSIPSLSDDTIDITPGAPDGSIVVELDGTTVFLGIRVEGPTELQEITSFLDTTEVPTYPLTTRGKQWHDSVNGLNHAGEGTLSDHTERDKNGNIVSTVPTGTQDKIFNGTVRKANGTHPSFEMARNASVANITGDGTPAPLVFDRTIREQGGNFAASTFTAPVDGFYPLGVLQRIATLTSAHTAGTLTLITSNNNYFSERNIWNCASGASGAGRFGWNMNIETWMDAGDTASWSLTVFNGAKTVNIEGSATLPLGVFYGHLSV